MDHIQNLLLQTGWNCDELMQKIQEYRDKFTTSKVCKETETSSQHLENNISLIEVENDHSYTYRKEKELLNKNAMQGKTWKEIRLEFYKKYIKPYSQNVKKTYNTTGNFVRKIKHRYKLQLKYANTDRKMLIHKYKSKEVVRTELMQQLELLRSKRSLPISSSYVKPTIISNQIFSKKRYSSEKVACSENHSTCSKDSCDIIINTDNVISNHESDTTTNNNVISTKVADSVNNILMYINSNDSIRQTCNEECFENKSDLNSIKPTKTNDITKIKGWKNKKFTTSENKLHENSINTSQEQNNNHPENVFSGSDIKAAFSSLNLDGFLHNVAHLPGSFEISHSEDVKSTRRIKSSITNKQFTSTLSPNNITELPNVQKIERLNLYRPRTLAQKQRIWKLSRNKSKLEDSVKMKPRTLAEKRRMLDTDVDLKTKSKVTEVVPKNNLRYSFIIYRGRRLKIPTKTPCDVMAYIRSSYGKKEYVYVPRKVKPIKPKPSIFSTTPTRKSQVVRYKPGPLSKKVFLQENNSQWKTEIKPLPKVYLHIRPTRNKPIYPKIQHLLPQYDFDLTDERITFALSALDKKPDEDEFIFPVPYANKQEHFILRRKVDSPKELLATSSNVEDSKSVEETVEIVVNKILDYVEIKSISNEVVIDDVTEKLLKEEKANVNEQTNQTTKKRKIKQSKTNYELKRLNVKVIEVNLEDRGENEDCKKDYCKLGCVCKSLTTTSSLVSNHCGVPECMFGCNCNYKKKNKGNLKVTLPIGTDLLSEGAVNRLEVEAKKNLAREEKEFTQTVIQANNQTIVVGGCTNRQRRVTKLPKKYNDFIESSEEIESNTQQTDNVKGGIDTLKGLKNWKPVPFTIQIPKLDLQQVIPYCMVHYLHDCYCNYSAVYKPIKEQVPQEPKPKVHKLSKVEPVDSLDTEVCARTKGIPTTYYMERNKTPKFVDSRKRKLDRIYKEYMAQENITFDNFNMEVFINNEQFESQKSIDITGLDTHTKTTRRKQSLTIRQDMPLLKPLRNISTALKDYRKITPKDILSEPTNVLSTVKDVVTTPKDVLYAPNDVSSRPQSALQRRKKYKKYQFDPVDVHLPNTPSNSEMQSNDTKPSLNDNKEVVPKSIEIRERITKFDQIFQTKTNTSINNPFTPSLSIQEKLNQIIGKNVDSQTQFRFIPWDILVQKYESNSIQLWYSTYFKKPRIIATDNTTIPRHFINVKSYENVPRKDSIKADLIRWLVTRKVPGSNCKENIFVILQLTKTHCELCGLWEKKQNTSDKMMLLTEPCENKQHKGTEDPNVNKDSMYSIVRKIMYSKCKFSKQILTETSILDDLQNMSTITAYLPLITPASKWRMIKLNSDFSVLSLHRNKYAIKYSDLQKILKMAKETSFTIVLKTPEVETNYPHPDFGIYSSADCEDIIFVGPYYKYEDDDITTLRYANRELISTESFCKMKGQSPICTSTWLYQLSTTTPAVNENVQTIDLTECDSDSETKKAHYQDEIINESVLDDDISYVQNEDDPLFTPGHILTFESCATDYQVPSNFYKYTTKKIDTNKIYPNSIYFVINVPDLGYVLGHMLRKGVAVRWPSRKYVIKFPDITDAVLFLERELTTYFMKKSTFQINVNVKLDIEGSQIKPFDSHKLKGYYIVHEKGFVHVLDLKKSMLKEIDMTKEEIELLGRERASRMIFDKCYELARKLFMPSILQIPNNSCEILEKLIKEIKFQEKTHEEIVKWLNFLHKKKQILRVKCSSVIKKLSPLVSKKMNAAMVKILTSSENNTEEIPGFNSNNVTISINDVSEDINADVQEIEDVSPSTTSPPSPSSLSSPSLSSPPTHSYLSPPATSLPSATLTSLPPPASLCTSTITTTVPTPAPLCTSTITTTVPTPPPLPLSTTPKITLRKLQDLKEPKNPESSVNSNQVNGRRLSLIQKIIKIPEDIAKTGVGQISEEKNGINNDIEKNIFVNKISKSSTITSSETNTPKKTVMLKRSPLDKKKFVIKTNTGKYMTISASDIKQLPVKKLTPLKSRGGIIPKSNTLQTKRIILPQANGFININDLTNFCEKSTHTSNENSTYACQSTSKQT